MAKILFSGIGVVDARGKCDNVVYSRNRAGKVQRAYVIPTNTITARKTTVQNQLAYVAQLWPVLPESNREEWALSAALTRKTNVFGDDYFSSGYHMFVQQTYMILLGGNIPSGLPVPPVFFHRPKDLSIDIPNLASMFYTVTWTNNNTSTPAGVGFILRASVGVSAGIGYKRSAINYILGEVPLSSTNNVSFLADYSAVWGGLVSGTKIFFEGFAFHTLTGQRVAPLSFQAIVP
jgi:hypothetical protein